MKSYGKSKNKTPNSKTFLINIQQMRNLIADNSLTDGEFLQLNPDSISVVGSDQTEDRFTIILSTKSLLLNCYKQSQSGVKFLALNGTYRLNNIRYPSIILGTVDSNRKLHLSKKS